MTSLRHFLDEFAPRRSLRVPHAAKVARLRRHRHRHAGLGIGANAAMFGVIDRLMFRPYAVPARPGDASIACTCGEYRGNAPDELAFRVHALPRPQALDDDRFASAPASPTRPMAVGAGDARASGRSPPSARPSSASSTRDRRSAVLRRPPRTRRRAGADVAVLGYGFWKSRVRRARRARRAAAGRQHPGHDHRRRAGGIRRRGRQRPAGGLHPDHDVRGRRSRAERANRSTTRRTTGAGWR